jgi:cell division cycle 20-like protein 1 (cofactor of APC complex)
MDESASSLAYDYGVGEKRARGAGAGITAWEERLPDEGEEQACKYSDRFIPSRASSNLESGFLLLDENARRANSAADGTRDENSTAYNQLLRSELLGIRSSAPADRGEDTTLKTPESKNLFHYKSSPRVSHDDPFSLLPVPFQSSDLFNAPRKMPRKIAKVPFKVLDAPQLQDDFYLNLVDWSSANVLSVGLSNCVYLWSACTSRVTKLCDLGPDDAVTSVSWTQRGSHLAVGTNKGEVQIWDSTHCKKMRTMTGHRGRVGTMAWNGFVLSTGSRDHHILHRDVRQQTHFMSRLQGHRQEVCGLKWSYDEQQLASGGNDNKLYVWNMRSTSPVLKFNEHQAAVKAIAWSPHQHGLLASGGGTADRCIRFWNTVNSTAQSCIDTGSQVCNLIWSKNVNEIVSTHGYSLNQIILWKYPSMTKVTTLTGHTYRVLYLAISPDGQTIVTGAGDETLRFWNVFPGTKTRSGSGLSAASLPMGRTIR